MNKFLTKTIFTIAVCLCTVAVIPAQNFERDFPIATGGAIEVKNQYGRVYFLVDEELENTAKVSATSTSGISDSDLRIDASGGKIRIEVLPQTKKNRVDFLISLPERTRVSAETDEGEIRFIGDFTEANGETNTGTIYADVPLENVKYDFEWTASRPRFLSEVDLAEVKEKSAGRFVLKGKLNEPPKERINPVISVADDSTETVTPKEAQKSKKKRLRNRLVTLNLSTARGIILLNVSPAEVPSNLRARPLTHAAKAIIRSGDSLLTNAIRRATPKYFGEYAATLPPRMTTPTLGTAAKRNNDNASGIKRVTVQVTDINNRAIAGLTKEDFELAERGAGREVISVEPSTAAFNLVLLLDVSGSIEHYVDFIRKAARSFLDTTSPQDRIAIVTFNEDVTPLSGLTKNRIRLSESLDTFDAGGGTAYYDALAYSLTDTLKSLQGERTAIVVLSDGDDNRSFLPFNSLLGSIQESGALIYPLYVPSGLIASSTTNDPTKSVDPLRSRYIALTSKAQNEGETLAKVSGGVYYPISRLSELQGAYDDIVKQLRTAYSITYRSKTSITSDRTSPRLKVKVKRKTAFVKLGPIINVGAKKVSQVKKKSQHKIFDTLEPNNKFGRFFVKTSYANRTKSDELPEITGELDSIKYKQFVGDKLKTYKLETLDINKAPGAFLVSGEKENIAVSRWISPKRTRSYPYERVYDTLAQDGKKVAVIPVLKDEGLGGDRDFIQWDTISLLSLLDVHVVLAYYSDAIKNPRKADKITKQKFDTDFVNTRLNSVFSFTGSAREWNEREAKNLKKIFEKARLEYRKISKKTGTYLHNEDKLDERIKYAETPQLFMRYSRRRSRSAQRREYLTIQPNEALSTLSKAKVTITNALFGKYYFTVDETLIEPNTISLIEAKHTSRSKMPSKNDIKDGLIKMMLYTNLRDVKFGDKRMKYKVAIRLTSNKIDGSISSNADEIASKKFFDTNLFKSRERSFLTKLFQEARENKFEIILENGDIAR